MYSIERGGGSAFVKTRAPDGGLIGWRHYAYWEGLLYSPYRYTLWEGPVLTAPVWSDSVAVRGQCGIHAVWPQANGECSITSVPPSRGAQLVLARVVGYGRYVMGTEGWRAERVIIERVELQLYQAEWQEMLSHHYRDVEIVVVIPRKGKI